MKDVAMSGKKHLIIGSHSNLIRCVMKRIKRRNLFSRDVKVGEKSVEAKWQDSVGGAFNVYRNKIDNGAVLTFDLEVEVEAGSATPVFSNLGLQSPIRGYPYIGDLRIRVVRGERLVAKDASGTSDPYARLSFGGHTEVDSETVWTNLNPEWNFESSFKVVSAMQVIRLSVWDKNIGRSSDFLGDAIIPVFGVVFGVLETKSLSTKINLEHIEHGEVYLELAFRAAEE
jgi:Ca2+-dependent lipid-binding protein